MNKAELINAVAEETGLTKADAESCLNSMANQVEDALRDGDDVTLPGIGKLSVKPRAARTGRNPRTGEAIQIAAKNVVAFKVTKPLADSIA